MTGTSTRSHRGLFWAAVLASLVALVGGTLVAFLTYRQSSAPDAAVQGYFRALQHGDAPKALAYGDVPAGPHELLTSTVLREQQRIAPIHDVRIVSVDRRGSSATLTVGYRLDFPADAVAVTDTVRVRRHGSSWRLTQSAVPTAIGLTQARERASIVGAAVPDGDTLLFPGAIPIRFDTPNLQIAAGSGTVTFTTGPQVDVNVQVSPAGRRAVATAITRQLAACYGGSTKPDTRCPLPAGGYVPGSLSGRVDQDVAGQLTLDVETTRAGVIDVSGSIGFVGRYRTLDFDNLAATHSGSLQLPLHASTYASVVDPQWTAPQ